MWQMWEALNLMCVSSQDQPSYSGLAGTSDTPIACKCGSWLFSLEPKAPQWAKLAVVKSSFLPYSDDAARSLPAIALLQRTDCPEFTRSKLRACLHALQ